MSVGLQSVLLIVALALCGPNAGAQAKKPDSWKLNAIRFTGLDHCTRDRAVTISGLQMGQTVDAAALDAANARLAKSGFFKRVTYNYLYKNEQMDLTFAVEEARWIPVMFDNFAWFSDDEIAKTVRAEEPLFDGKAPASDEMINSIKRALERLLGSRGLPAEVEYVPSYEFSGEGREHIFRVIGARIPICGLRFPNAVAITESELVKLSKPLLAEDFSLSFARNFAQLSLIPAYRERGHLRARFSPPTAVARSDAGCKNGAEITLAVDEGIRYVWEKAEWSGNDNAAAEELSGLLGFKAGDVANGLKMDAGVKSVSSAYRNRGFIDVRLNTTPVFDDEKKLVVFRITLNEGPQYHMGELTISGLAERDAENLRKKWRLEPGQVFNVSYVEDFAQKELPRFGVPAQRLNLAVKPDRRRFTVDIAISVRK